MQTIDNLRGDARRRKILRLYKSTPSTTFLTTPSTTTTLSDVDTKFFASPLRLIDDVFDDALDNNL
ncbi:MAG: hypothetical protein LBF59_01855 [Prevotellaceae bacterium]|nr:hypothetical protein [Prevotellaceae bacterium]